ncbi:MAG: hypothetical protein V1656_00410 [Candidatus Jorgensenbacteria bacterium]
MTTLIRGGLVCDGSGTAPVQADVLIRGNRIVRVGEIGKVHAHITVDAAGAMVTPGFIDVGGEIDHHLALFSEPHAAHLLRQGITTVIGGNGGVSLAPLLDGSLRAVERWTSTDGVHVRGETVKKFLKWLGARGLGVNFGTLAGYTTVRRALTRDAFRDLTERESAALEKVLSRACRDGAFGISVDLSDAYAREISFRELRMLGAVAARAGRVLAVNPLRRSNAVEKSVEEILRVAREEKVNLEVSRFTPLAEHREAYARALALLDKATTSLNVHFDVYPSERIPVPLTALLPEWLQAAERGETLRYLRTEEGERRVSAHLERFRAVPFSVAYVPSRHLASLEGKALADLALHGHHPFGRALIFLMGATELRAVLMAPLADSELLGRCLLHEHAHVSAGGLPRGPRAFPPVLRAARGGILPLERAVEKLTSLAARKFGIAKRGILKPGYFADVAVLRNGTPSDVFVNGQAALRDGLPEPIFAGAVLRPATSLW